MYLFGSDVTVDAPVENDVVAAGGNVTMNGNITGSLMAAGGNVTVRSTVGNTMRVAGGNVIISGTVNRDLLVAGGSVRITKEASVSGDIIFAGGELRVEGPVRGNIAVNGGNVFLNSTVGGKVEGSIGALTLGNKAVVAGDLTYQSNEKANIQQGATLQGKHDFKQLERRDNKPDGLAAAFTAGALYKLAIDIIGSLLLVLLVPLLVKRIIARSNDDVLTSLGTGFIFCMFFPLLALLLLFFIWPGIAALLLYALVLVLNLFIGKLLLGWWLVRWWQKREGKEYMLDWKTAIVGPVALFLLFLIPVLGWLIATVIYLISLGGLVRTILTSVYAQREMKPIKIKK